VEVLEAGEFLGQRERQVRPRQPIDAKGQRAQMTELTERQIALYVLQEQVVHPRHEAPWGIQSELGGLHGRGSVGPDACGLLNLPEGRATRRGITAQGLGGQVVQDEGMEPRREEDRVHFLKREGSFRPFGGF
jgi:hypothetical protein